MEESLQRRISKPQFSFGASEMNKGKIEGGEKDKETKVGKKLKLE